MGYYVLIEDSNLTIRAENLDGAFEAMKALNSRDDLKHGGAWSGGKQTATWFSWMDADYDKTSRDAAHILEQLGFEFSIDDEGDLSITGYDNKIGSEEHFLHAIAPFVESGSMIIWRGEDEERIMDLFLDGSHQRNYGMESYILALNYMLEAKKSRESRAAEGKKPLTIGKRDIDAFQASQAPAAPSRTVTPHRSVTPVKPTKTATPISSGYEFDAAKTFRDIAGPAMTAATLYS